MPSENGSATGGSAATQAVDADAHRWATRRGVALTIRVVAIVVPFAASLLVARMLQEAMGSAHTLFGHVVRWTIVIIGSTTVLVTADRVTRHLLPIAALFKVALVFPDKAPSRYKVALRSGSSASLARQVRAGGELGSTPAEAAENALILLKDLGNHDRLTRGHSERVRAYSEIIAEEMDLPEADRERLRWAALIHDVGKMAVAPEILNKPGRPSDEEWQELRQHPAAAARMLAPLEPWLGEWIGAATEHHERFDGKGYPNGLRGDETSLAGRIVAVADAYDCMTSARSYKKALPPEQARYELSRNAGTQFDPVVVRAFLNVSVGRLHLAGGPLAWLSSVPGLRDVATGLSGVAASTTGAVAATGLALVAVAAGQLPAVVDQPDNAHAVAIETVFPTTTVLPPQGAPPVPSAAGTTTTTSRPPGSTTTPPPTVPTATSADPPLTTTTTTAPVPAATDAPPAEPPTTVAPTTTATTSTTAPTTTTTTTEPTTTTTEPTTTTTSTSTTTTTTAPTTTTSTTSTTTTAPTTTTTTTAPTTTTSTSTTTTTTLPPTGGAPNAVNDSRTVQSGSNTNIDVLANDSDPDADLDRNSLRIVSGPSIGSANVQTDHKIRYQAPILALAASTSLVYEICDLQANCDQATLSIDIFILGLAANGQGAAPDAQLLAVIPEPERRRRGWRVRRPDGPHG